MVRRILLLTVVFLPLICSADRPFSDFPEMEVEEVRFMSEDNPEFANPDYPDADWQVLTDNFIPMNSGPHWLRIRVSLPEDLAWSGTPYGLGIFIIASYELYWDGNLLTTSGTIGSSSGTEIPGPLDNLVHIPSHLLEEGSHLIAIRLSSYHGGFPSPQYSLGWVFDEYQELVSRPLLQALGGYGVATLFSFIAIFFIGYFILGDRRPLHLSFAFLCLAVAAFNVVNVLRHYPQYTYEWHYPNRILLFLTAALTCSAFIRMLIDWLELKPARRIWLLCSVIVFLSYWMSPYSRAQAYWLIFFTLVLMIFIAFLPSLGRWKSLAAAIFTMPLTLMAASIPTAKFMDTLPVPIQILIALLLLGIFMIAIALKDKRPGVRLFMAATALVLLFFIGSSPGRLDQSINLIASPIVMGIFGGVLIDLRTTRRRMALSRINKARLEAEMLRKQLQPHFLLNTLTSLAAWVEENPPRSVHFIEELANELRSLFRISDKDLIPLSEELDLCRSHLTIMSFRKHREYTLEADPPDPSRMVPPAILHTLIENAITHFKGQEVEIRIRIEFEETESHFSMAVHAPAKDHLNGEAGREGGGLRYVKARLAEAYGNAASVTVQTTPDSWITRIDIPNT